MRFRRRPGYVYADDTKKHGKSVTGLALILILLLVLFAVSLFLSELSTQMAVSDASDAVTAVVNRAIRDIIGKNDYPGDYFIDIEKDSEGRVCAISSNMAHINSLSADILDYVISKTDTDTLKIEVPVGNLSGINLLLGKGPGIPVDIIVLTSSRVDFRNEIFSLGINQSKYQLYIDVTVDIDVLIPWGTESATVVTELLVTDTVIVGQVPQTYYDLEY